MFEALKRSYRHVGLHYSHKSRGNGYNLTAAFRWWASGSHHLCQRLPSVDNTPSIPTLRLSRLCRDPRCSESHSIISQHELCPFERCLSVLMRSCTKQLCGWPTSRNPNTGRPTVGHRKVDFACYLRPYTSPQSLSVCGSGIS